jgi:hypothetical protein
MHSTLYLTRIINGAPVLYQFVIDKTQTILSEQIVSATTAFTAMPERHALPVDPVLNAVPQDLTREAMDAELKSRGVEFTRSEDGRTTILTKIPPLEQKLLTFFTDSAPCWFDGCEELRAQYNAELEARGGETCPGCKKGAIIRKYMMILRTHPGVQHTQMSN